jgi:hypothetical protein
MQAAFGRRCWGTASRYSEGCLHSRLFDEPVSCAILRQMAVQVCSTCLSNHARDQPVPSYKFDSTYDAATWMRTSLQLAPHAVFPRCYCYRCAWRRKNRRFWDSLPGFASMFPTGTPTDGVESDNSETQLSIVAGSRSPPMNDDPYAMQNVFDSSTGDYLHSYVVPETFFPLPSTSRERTYSGGAAAGGAAATTRSRPGQLQLVRSRMEMAPKLPQIPLLPLAPVARSIELGQLNHQ